MMTDEPMTAVRRDRRDANIEPKADLNIDTWSQNLCPQREKRGAKPKAEPEIAHYRGAVERSDTRIRGFLC
jgi:hypothetical protein